MLFSSNVFLFLYLPIVLILYYASSRKLRNLTLFLASLVFYGWGEPVYLFLMVAVIALNYVCGCLISRFQGRGRKRTLIVGVALNLLILGFFKYAGFLVAAAKSVLPFLAPVTVPEIPLPIGISFYTFQSMSYIIDVYRRDAPVQKNPITFGTYVALFPQLIAGPIVRYYDVAKQLVSRKETVPSFASGVRLFIVGLGKKVLLANRMGALWLSLEAAPGTAAAWAGIAAYSLQLYFDFSGYSDMAIGLGRMFGISFLENFRYPYIASSITDFWRRWHISLSTWFREYVYIPLGGNRRGLRRQILNLLIVWGLTGLWHGASWNFLLWGLYYGLFLIAEKVFLLKGLNRVPGIFRHLYTLLVVMVGWALFYFEDMDALGAFFTRAFVYAPTGISSTHLILGYLPLMIAAGAAATPIAQWISKKGWARSAVLEGLFYTAVFLLSVASLVSQSYNPFIYFRF